VSPVFNRQEVQGNILRGYRRSRVRHLILEVPDRAAARKFLGASVAGGNVDVPGITSEAPWSEKPPTCFNVGLTYEGFRALGTYAESLATFPIEFIEGMTSRALKVGDFGPSAPESWPAPFNEPARVHIVASIYADDTKHLDGVESQVARAFNVLSAKDGRNLPGDKVFFGFDDSISQPRFAEIRDPDTEEANEPIDPLGTALLGYPTRLEGLVFRVPEPAALGFNGSFNAFRILKQDVAGFEAYLDEAAKKLVAHPDVDQLLAPGSEGKIGKGLDRVGALREVVAAQMCGRWRNGVPYGASPDAQWPDEEVSKTNFDYGRTSRCPAGSHMRRVNPRGGTIVQRIANYSGGWCGAACPTARITIPTVPTMRSAGCSAISSVQASARSTRRSCATGSTSACKIPTSPGPTIH
jgi:deferrochelatase/peroxidase EfeB